jgi:chemotaxis protein MotB
MRTPSLQPPRLLLAAALAGGLTTGCLVPRSDLEAAQRDLAAARDEGSATSRKLVDAQGQLASTERRAQGAEQALAAARKDAQQKQWSIEELNREAAATQKALKEAASRAEARGQKVGEITAELERTRLAAEESARKLAEVERARAEEASRREQEFQDAQAQLKAQIDQGVVELSRYKGDRIGFRLADRVLFPSGSAVVTAQGRQAIQEVSQVIRAMLSADTGAGKIRLVRVEGHTDDVPIATERFPSNWELSSARATAVVRFLEGAGLPREKLWAAGFGEMWPVATNTTAEGRARNRRIEVVLVPDAEKPAVGAEASAPPAR